MIIEVTIKGFIMTNLETATAAFKRWKEFNEHLSKEEFHTNPFTLDELADQFLEAHPYFDDVYSFDLANHYYD